MGPALRALEIPGEGTAGVASGSPRPWGVWGTRARRASQTGLKHRNQRGARLVPPTGPTGTGT